MGVKCEKWWVRNLNCPHPQPSLQLQPYLFGPHPCPSPLRIFFLISQSIFQRLGYKCKIFTCKILHFFTGVMARIKHRAEDGTPKTQHGGQHRIEEPGLRTKDAGIGMDWTIDRGLGTDGKRASSKDRT